jgi:hypothetical protein
LVDNVYTDLGQAINISFTRPEISPFDGVVKEPVNTVAIVLIIFCGINASLGGDAMSAAWAVLEAEDLHVVTKFRHGRGCGSASQSGAHHDHLKLSFVGRVDQFHFEAVFIPFLG